MPAIKERVRDVFGIGKHSVHINDTHAQAVDIGNLLLNDNSVHFLDFANYRETGRLRPLLDEFRRVCASTNTALTSVVIDGSAVLAAYGLRTARDLDYQTVLQPAPLLTGFDLHAQTLVHHGCTSAALVCDPRRHFYFAGCRFVSLPQLARMKRNRGEEKDLRDCDLIETVLTPSRGQRPLADRWKRRIRFLVARNRGWLEKLEHLPLYPLARAVYRRVFK